MASIPNSVTLNQTSGAEIVRPRRSLWRGPRFLVEIFDGADEALAALEAVQGGLVSTGFQTLNWLTVLYEELAAAQRSMPRLVVVTERNSSEVAMILPLVVKKKRALRVARFADFSVSDYGAPILGPALLKKPRSIRRAWRAVRRSLRDVDMVRLEKMPVKIGRRTNPLISRRGITPSRRGAMIVKIAGSVDDYVGVLGETFGKEIGQGLPWRDEPMPIFERAIHPEDVARGYAALDEQEPVLQDPRDRKGLRDDAAHRQFYERLVMDGCEVGLGHLFTLRAGTEIISTLFGIQHDGTFTLLRLSSAGARRSGIRPERLILVEVMRHFVERGVSRFDLGLGDTDIKRAFGAAEVPLYDLIIARDLIALPRAAFHRLKGRARKNLRLRAFFHRLGALRSR